MALNIPMPDSPGDSLLKGLDTSSTVMSRIMEPIIQREKLKQQQAQFAQNFALRQKELAQKSSQGTPFEGPARYALDLDRLKKQYGENSEVYKNAKLAYDQVINSRQDLSDLRQRTMTGLKPGETEFFDDKTNQPLGKNVPYTDKERQMEQGNILFNNLYPYVYKGASPYSGEGSITRLQNDAANYKTDPQARKRFDDFLLANKMMAATAVNEVSTLGARASNQTYNMLKTSLDAQDIPSIVSKLITQYEIPASAQLKAAMSYQKILSDSRIKATQSVPATRKLYYNPGQQTQYDQQGNSGNVSVPDANKTNLPTQDTSDSGNNKVTKVWKIVNGEFV